LELEVAVPFYPTDPSSVGQQPNGHAAAAPGPRPPDLIHELWAAIRRVHQKRFGPIGREPEDVEQRPAYWRHLVTSIVIVQEQSFPDWPCPESEADPRAQILDQLLVEAEAEQKKAELAARDPLDADACRLLEVLAAINAHPDLRRTLGELLARARDAWLWSEMAEIADAVAYLEHRLGLLPRRNVG
jgi:hypothetical protein